MSEYFEFSEMVESVVDIAKAILYKYTRNSVNLKDWIFARSRWDSDQLHQKYTRFSTVGSASGQH